MVFSDQKDFIKKIDQFERSGEHIRETRKFGNNYEDVWELFK